MRKYFHMGLILFLLVLGYFQKIDAGSLNFKGFISTVDAGTNGLRGAHGIVFTPNGKTLYASASDGSAISWFSRDSKTGNLSFEGLIRSGEFLGDGLGQPKSVALSPDASTIYAGGFLSHNILWFNRDPLTDSLKFSGSIGRINDTLPSLAAVRNLVISADGGQVFATASEGNAVFWFTRNVGNGSLTYAGNIESAKDSLPGLRDPRPITVSKDGQFVYVGNHVGNSILCFRRNAQTGGLTFASSVTDNQAGVDGLDGVQDIKLSADNSYLYVAGYSDQTIAWFSRSPITGALTFKNLFRFPPGDIDPLMGASALAISQNGKFVFAGSYRAHCLSWFHRNPENGDLTLGGYSRNGYDGVEGITGVEYILLSPDEKHLYVSSGRSAALAWFDFPDSTMVNVRENWVHKNARTPMLSVTTFKNLQGFTIQVKDRLQRTLNISIHTINGLCVFEKRFPNSRAIQVELTNGEIVPGILVVSIAAGGRLLFKEQIPIFQ